MTAREVCQRVWDISAPCAAEMGIHLWDVTFEKEGGQYMLTITIDREGHTDIDDCEKLSRYVDPFLDEKEFASLPPYTLCVSSAGLTRRLRRPEHFASCMGQEVELRFYRPINGSRTADHLRYLPLRLLLGDGVRPGLCGGEGGHAGGGRHRHRL